MVPVSVITLVHHREPHLRNLVRGLCQSTNLPQELIIIYMNEKEFYPLPATPFALRQYHIASSSSHIPLSEARNAGAQAATQDLLIFLDVDCIPATNLLSEYLQANRAFSGLLMGDIRYLPPGSLPDDWSPQSLRERGVAHPQRPVITKRWESCERYELFWSLNFAIRKADFERIGGFDTRYQGYGAEDTDFAFMARQQALPFALSRATAYHQHHPVYRPPLQHFEDIVANAGRFYVKWQCWPMEGWLGEFAERQLIRWKPTGTRLEIIRQPSESEIEAAHHEAPAGF